MTGWIHRLIIWLLTLGCAVVQAGTPVFGPPGGGGEGGGGGVTSVFGRAGVVTAQQGDYSLDQLGDVSITAPAAGQILAHTGSGVVNQALLASQVPGLDAAKIITGVIGPARLGSGVADATTFLRGDGSWAVPSGGGASAFGDLTDVTLSAPTQFQIVKFDGANWVNGNMDAADVASGTFADSRIAQSNVTQHQGALALGGAQITSGTIPGARLPLPAAAALGGVTGDPCTAGQFVTGVSQVTGAPICSTPSGGGDVVGPAAGTDNALTRFDGTTGKLIQNSGATLDDVGNMTLPGTLTADAIDVGGTGAAIFGGNQLPAATGLADPAVGEFSLSVLDTGALATRIAGQVQRVYPDLTQILTIPAASGLISHTGSGATVARSITAGDSLLSVTDGDGVAGSPAIAVATPSGTGASVVTTTGAQTSGNCVSIDAAGNHVAAGAPCGSVGGGGATWDFIRLGGRTASNISNDESGWWIGNTGVEEAFVSSISLSDASDRSMQFGVRAFKGGDLDPNSVVAAVSVIPPDFDGGTIRITLHGRTRGGLTGGLDIVFRVHAACTSGNIAGLDLWVDGQQIAETFTINSQNFSKIYDQSFTPLTMGCAAGDQLYLGVIRLHLDAADTETDTVDVNMLSVRYGLQ